MPDTTERRDGYVGQPGFNLLNLACWPIVHALGVPYLVGSATNAKGWRDVDVRVMLDDARFAELFGDTRGHRTNPLWALMCGAIASHLSHATGLPVDFQIQSQTDVDTHAYRGLTRIPLGIFPTPATTQES